MNNADSASHFPALGRLHARMGDDVSVAMQVNEGDVVRFRTKSSIQAGFTEGIPLALSLVDALQVMILIFVPLHTIPTFVVRAAV